jgi:predicted transcriptional regulator
MTQKQLQRFYHAAESLKLYRRADLHDPEKGTDVIESLYVDPLPHDQVLQKVLRANTTFLIGRKGTGKSTIFQRLQSELRKTRNKTSAYVDIKTLYESSQVDPQILSRVSKQEDTLPSEFLKKLLLYREFLNAVIYEIKEELYKRLSGSLWEKIKESFTGNLADLFEGLNSILEEAEIDRFMSVLGFKAVSEVASTTESHSASAKGNVSVALSASPEIALGIEGARGNESQAKFETQYADILMRVFNIKVLLVRLKEILGTLKIRNLYILIDDFSELPEDAMKVVVDALLAPLNNWSDEFIKFKIAAYPGRIYYGQIDKTKIDEVFLDLYELYGSGDVSRMEESAIRFTQRLVEGRIKHFCNCNAADFFDSDFHEPWRLLFFSSMANPRNLGWILTYLYEGDLIHGRKIGPRAIREATRKYYDEKIESYFRMGKFLHETFNERSSIFSLKELLESIVNRAKELRLRKHTSEVMEKIPGRPPTSHFHVVEEFEALLSTLELNFFITRYYHMSDRDGRKVVIYALNYGLCQKFSIEFGRPAGERKFRTYFIERVFDYTSIMQAFIKENQEIVCAICGHRYSFEDLQALRFYGMKCRDCATGICEVVNLSKKYADELKKVDAALLLPSTELGILQTLHTEDQPLNASSIATELDCSYQLVGKRGRNLADRGLVERSENEQGRRIFKISEIATKTYFTDTSIDKLDVPTD